MSRAVWGLRLRGTSTPIPEGETGATGEVSGFMGCFAPSGRGRGTFRPKNGHAVAVQDVAGQGGERGVGLEVIGLGAGQAELGVRQLLLAAEHIEVRGAADLEAGAPGADVEGRPARG